MLACRETGADPALAALAALMVPDAEALHPLLDRLALTREERDRVSRAAEVGGHLAHRLSVDMPDSRIHALLHGEPLETLAVTLAWGAPGGPVLRYLSDLRGARLEVTGDDLVAAGVPESPALGRALEETLRRKLDGEVSGREDEPGTGAGAGQGDGLVSEPRTIDVELPGGRVAFSTRQGGVSEGPYESLNLGILTDDDQARVNRGLLAGHIGSTRSAWRWAGRCTAPTSASGPRRRTVAGTPRPARTISKVDGHATEVRARAARAGGGLPAGRA